MAFRMITREQWGAEAPRYVNALASKERVFVHYSGMDSDEVDDHDLCYERVRGIQRYHKHTKKWADIAYSFVVCTHGFVFEGRGFGVHTAATGPCNFNSHAICFLGDDTAGRDDVTDRGRVAIRSVFDEIERRYGNQSAHGHRNCMSTTCPGDELMSWVERGMPVEEKVEMVRFVLRAPGGKRLAASAAVRPDRGENRRLRQFFTALAADETERQKERRAAILKRLKKGERLRLTREEAR